ncbi:hypothetical protein CHLNCDRAFT_141354 [Chlorella variabilis]|uniref:Uncharacterized protein n=1 Tax=Chlorella variabilis TaxID=554065 RepID=E1ZSP9_CHLVA|nr:hypothetical protein CHLNCDRAFT_141354 [Chlorella variabilis]EFN51190.1 hypothetical protein CHLNCDRAFT_141354 [Chlorella variabilis]|eukprot:XP_005843292.1 hypothetical protein CHLNCDRAFT_141354 [Chlorella variabilis]
METIVELRAGCMVLADGRLAPDPRKGLIRITQARWEAGLQDEAGLTHFCWLERDASGAAVGEPEQDIVVIPGESTFGKIARPGSRVFELRFPEEKHRNLFFWAQEAAAESDEDYVAAVNLALNQGEGEEEQGGAQGMEGVEAGAAAASPAAAAAGAVASGAAGGGGVTGIGAADLAAVLGSLLAGGAGQGASGQAGRRLAADPGPSLSDVLRPELLAPLLRSPDMVQRLAPFLPEEHRSADAISELVSTPQFRHQLDLFSHALMTGQLDASQFGLPPGGYGVLEFLAGIQRQADNQAGAAANAGAAGDADGRQQ